MNETTQILEDLSAGNRAKVDRLSELVYAELRGIAASFMSRENASHVLQPTALVHEAFLKLTGQERVDWKSRSHFLAVGAQAMRRILVDSARGSGRQKRGGDRQRVEFSPDLVGSDERDLDILSLNEAIEKLRSLNELQSKIVELRFFSGMTVDEVAEALNVSKRTVERQWTATRAWLRRELSGEEHE